ncbi:hypothetical protein OF829_09775 [Sphingomonas sp. LB-2]|nr:hypothetical protein [Sphingomonas caeni]
MRLALLAITLTLSACGGGSMVVNADNAATPAEPANAANVAAPAPAPSVKLGDFELNQLIRAFGTEPFWTLDLGPGDMIFTDNAVETPKPEPFYWVAPVVAGDTATYTTKNVAGDPVVLVLTRKDCLEVGEPEDTQPLTAKLTIGTKVRTGCAGPKPKDEPDEEMENTTTP